MYHVEDGIKLPLSSNDLNPEAVYRMLDNDKSISKLKSYSVKLFPSCEGGLLSCHYSIKILVETNTLFSTNEEMNIPIDFYSPFNLSDNSNDNYEPIIIKKEEKNEKINMNNNVQNNEIKDEDQLDCNLNINQQIFINENKSEQNKESNKKQKKIKIKIITN